MTIRITRIILILGIIVIPIFGGTLFSPPVLLGATSTPTPILSAKGVAVYGWSNSVMKPLYVKNPGKLYPIASITKLITAKTVEALYPRDKLFTISSTAVQSSGGTPGIVAGATYTRDELLKALLISSSNDAAWAFMEPVGRDAFVRAMNTFLHDQQYTKGSFVNATGLDPLALTKLMPNRLTPLQLSRLVSDIYMHDRVLSDIMSKDEAVIHDALTGKSATISSTNELYYDDTYKNKILLSKTGRTMRAHENLVFVTPGHSAYDYITVVLLGSQHREQDSIKVLNWLDQELGKY